MISGIIDKSKSNPYSVEEASQTLGIDTENMLILANEYLGSIQTEMGILLTAINNNDYNHIREVAHKIKGTSANLGMNYISEVASFMEKNAREKIVVNYGSYYFCLHDLFNLTKQQLENHNN